MLFIPKPYSKSVPRLYHNSFRLPFIKMMSVCWLITLTGPSGKSLTQQGMRPWCPLYVSLCLHPTKKLLIWLQGEMQIKLFFSWVQMAATECIAWLSYLFLFLFLQNWAVIPECSVSVAPLSHQHEECGILALSNGWYTSHPQLECGLGMFRLLCFLFWWWRQQKVHVLFQLLFF